MNVAIRELNMSRQKLLMLAGLAISFALVGNVANAFDDEEDHHHGGGINHFLHDYGIPHSHGYEGDAHEYNHYLHDNGIPHQHSYQRQCYQIVDHDQYGRHFYRTVCQ